MRRLRNGASPDLASGRPRFLSSLLSLSLQFKKGKPNSGRPLQAEWQKRIRDLESLLRAEQARCRTQFAELIALRAEISRVKELQSDLAVERESGRLIIQWLQEAEQHLADLYRRFVAPAAEHNR